jgi:hypothetical protein
MLVECGRREKNGGDEQKQGIIYVHMEMSKETPFFFKKNPPIKCYQK